LSGKDSVSNASGMRDDSYKFISKKLVWIEFRNKIEDMVKHVLYDG